MLSDLKYIVDDIKLYCNKVRYVVGGGIASSSFIFDTAALQIIKSGECEGKMVSLLLRLITLPSWPCTKP